MQPRVEKLLLDVLKAIEEINSFSGIFKGDYNNYKTNVVGKRAIERELEIIGEAINKLQKEDAGIVITESRKIISLRNLIIHAYDSVDDGMIWSVLIYNIPVLEKEIRLLLINK